ncbi:MAG: IS1634 family transposase [Pseudonocardiales bacterium]|nr:MAG: IS1634 family transposase [Pseudonocardiales bacterium]
MLRRSFRDEAGRPRKETLANLSALPLEAIDALRKILKGATLVDAEVAFETERSVPHGDVAAAHVMATQLGLRKLLGPAGRERDVSYALILSRAVSPKSKPSTARWWWTGDTTLSADLGVADASTDEIYAAMDWLAGRQPDIEAQLAARHLCAGGIAMFDLSSSWVEGKRCELAAFGHSRDGKRGRPQIEYGLLTCPAGRPVAIEVFAGNTSDTVSFKTAVTRVRDDFGIEKIILVGDRGMITTTRITELRQCDGLDWITALRAPAIAALASDDGPLQPSLFDTCNLAEITHPNYLGERLICCRNPALADERARTRHALLAATEKDLDKIATSVQASRLTGADKIGERIGKVIGKHKVAKHFLREVTDSTFTYRRNEDKISAEAALDGIYVIRTSVADETLNSAQAVTAYKDLKYVERDFHIIKADDLDLRCIHHYLNKRVRTHVLICMLAAYLTWHLREALTELTFTDQHIPDRDDPVAPAQRSPQAKTKDATKHTPEGLPLHRYKDLLQHLSTLDRQVINFGGQRIEKITTPTPVQRRVFELLGTSIPVTLK